MQTTSQLASESCVRLGRQAPRISKLRAIWNTLHRSCYDSLAGLLAEEIYKSALRIAALFRKRSPYSRRALVAPPYPDELVHLSLAQESEYLFACSEDIQRLSHVNHWASNLDRQIALEAYLMGAAWAIRNGISERDEHSKSQ